MENEMGTTAKEPPKPIKTATVSNSHLIDGLCGKTIKACAELLDLEADRMEEAWNEYIKGGGKGPATTYHTIPRDYAKLIRGLAT